MNPILPDTAPFTSEQKAWLNGYIAGLLSGERLTISGKPVLPAGETRSLVLLYGSQTGTSEALSGRFAQQAKKLGFKAVAASMDDYSKYPLAPRTCLAIITSTYGEGEMPDNAQTYWKFLSSPSAPRLEGVDFSVLALGDRSYSKFCQAGKDFDRRLEELGARRIVDRADCDVEYEATSKAWFERLSQALGEDARKSSAESEIPVAEPTSAHSKARPFPSRVVENRRLNGHGSQKDTRHIELVLDGSGLTYEAGDALGVVPTNCPEFVDEILGASGLDGEEGVRSPSGEEKSLRRALVEDFDLRPFVNDIPSEGGTASDLVASLHRIQPRLYSISSSPKLHPGRVSLTVGVVNFETGGKRRKGACSTFLAERALPNVPVPVFVHRSPGFRPPKDPTVPMIMVGPGTGIAPFRAFLEERQATGATGRNWLFFGDQRSATDFLYREEVEAWQKSGLLTRVDTAFSRDQAEKVYIQSRMVENFLEIWTWLEAGAHFYVCGDASRMAKDVDSALHEVCRTAANMGKETAEAYVAKLRASKRYCRDVY